MLAKQDGAQQFGKALVARTSEIGLGRLRFDEPALRFLDHLQDRRTPGAVAEHADADIDLFRSRIGFGERNQRQQRIALDGRKIGEPFGLRVGSVSMERD